MAVAGDTVHVGYIAVKGTSPVRYGIWYARSTDLGLTWTIEPADTDDYGTGQNLKGAFRGGLALDPQGRPHMVYTIDAFPNSWCMHALRTGPGQWQHDTVESKTTSPVISYDADVKFDAQGRLHTVYTYYGGVTRYAVLDSTGWHRNNLSPNCYGVALALDSSGGAHTALGTTNNELKYGYSTDRGANWSIEQIATNIWWHDDVCLAGGGKPVIAYTSPYDPHNQYRVAVRQGQNNWATYLVESTPDYNCRPAIYYYPPENALYVSFYPYRLTNQLRLARSTDEGASWSAETVTSVNWVNGSAACPDFVRTPAGRFVAYQSDGYKLSFACDLAAAVLEPERAPLSRLRLYPNPARFATRVEGPGLGPGERVSVLDASGRVVAGSTALSGWCELDLRGLREGVYFCRADGAAAKFEIQR